MWSPASSTRSALALSMAAAVAFLGSAMMLKAGAFPHLAGGRAASDRPGVLVLSIVILLAATGALLAIIAGREAALRVAPAGARRYASS